MEPFIITRRLFKYTGQRCTTFKPGTFLNLEPDKDYFLTVRLYGSPLKFSAMRRAIPSNGDVMFIVPRSMLETEEGLYQIEIYDPDDKESFEKIQVINVGSGQKKCGCEIDSGKQVEETTNQ